MKITMKNFIVSEEELRKLLIHHALYENNDLKDFLADKQPVEMVAEGIVLSNGIKKYIAISNCLYLDIATLHIPDIAQSRFKVSDDVEIYIKEVK